MTVPTDRVVLSKSGTPLVYRVYGDHGPFLVGCNGVGVSTVFFEQMAAHLADRYRMVLWDYPGHGRSGDPEVPSEVSIPSLAEDLATVLDAAGAAQVVLIGHSLGTQVGFEFYRCWPERILGLVPTHGTYGRSLSTFLNLPLLALPMAALAGQVLPRGHRAFPPLLAPLAMGSIAGRAVLDHVARRLGLISRDAPQLDEYFAHLVRVDLRVFGALLLDAQRQDATELLTQVAVPTLVVGATRDLVVPLKVVRKLASLIPNAELFILDGATHAGLFEQAPAYEARVRKFLDERVFGDERVAKAG